MSSALFRIELFERRLWPGAMCLLARSVARVAGAVVEDIAME